MPTEFLAMPHFTWIAIPDILIVAFIIYQVLALIRGTRAVQMALGLALLIAFFYFSRWSRLETVSWLLTNVLPYFVFAIIVIFQVEIRRALVHFGKTPFFRGFSGINRSDFYDEMVLAATTLSANRTGALVIVERDIGLRSYIESGIAMDAVFSYDLIVTLFSPSVPLHDGAVIIQNGRIAAAACFLPLTVKPRLSKELGTRHRAAIGVTEETDAVAIIVSEETGAISFAHDGEIDRFLDAATLKSKMRNAFDRRSESVAPQLPAAHAEKQAGGSYFLQQIRRFLTHNWLTKLFSLLIAALLWATISSETTSEIGMTVPLEYRNIPPQLEVTGDATNNIEVRLRGASSLIKEISPRDVSAALDLGSMGPGERIVQLTSQNVKTPVGIEVVRLNPARVRLDIDRTVSKVVPIHARIEGVPAPGFAVINSKTTPDSIEIEGPESKVRAMESVSTIPIHVNGREEDFSEIVDIDIADPVIRLRSSTANVDVQVHIAQDSVHSKRQRQSR